jgi:hypothetical protein
MHDCAIPVTVEESKKKQGTLDGTVTHEPRMPVFTTNGMLDYIIELVVSEDNVHLPRP